MCEAEQRKRDIIPRFSTLTCIDYYQVSTNRLTFREVNLLKFEEFLRDRVGESLEEARLDQMQIASIHGRSRGGSTPVTRTTATLFVAARTSLPKALATSSPESIPLLPTKVFRPGEMTRAVSAQSAMGFVSRRISAWNPRRDGALASVFWRYSITSASGIKSTQ